VLGKYAMSLNDDSITGQGSSSICRKGINKSSGEPVAIKVYKDAAVKASDVPLRFRRQVKVLQMLQQPFDKKASDPNLWHKELENAAPECLFMQLIDFSVKNKEPGPDPTDNCYYVVTELAQYSLKDFLEQKRAAKEVLSKAAVKNIAKAIILVVAGLHAKGLVHIDLKPENIMSFSGRFKLIDVDGCASKGTMIDVQDNMISFSACYCSPQWAAFLIVESEDRISIEPTFDVWSLGLTLAELVSAAPVMKIKYLHILQHSSTHGQAGFLFMDWLKSVQEVPMPKEIAAFDTEFFDLLSKWMLVPKDTKRKSCAQCLDHGFFKDVVVDVSNSRTVKAADASMDDKKVIRKAGAGGLINHKGRVWKLASGGKVGERKDWNEFDMWIGAQGNLCYFDAKDTKTVILLDVRTLSGADIAWKAGGARGNQIDINYKNDDQGDEVVYLGLDDMEKAKEWEGKLKSVGTLDPPTMHLGDGVAELREFVISVKNRRLSVHAGDYEGKPVFKAMLWKLIADGDKKNEADWRQREMWMSSTGNLVYYSKKDERDLVYFGVGDLQGSQVKKIKTEESCKPFSFQVVLAQRDGVEFAPGEFAADSEELRQGWMDAFTQSASTEV